MLLSALAVSLAIPAAQADDSVRAAQEILKKEGYYTGTADGEFNADTKAAVRRYQIRNQLEPTGELTAETAAALNKGSEAATPASPPAPPVPAAPLATPPAASQPTAIPVPPTPSPAEDYRDVPRAPKGIPLPESQPAPAELSAPAYAVLFARTPYRTAPAEVQRDTLRKAQAILASRGFYQGLVNGLPGPDTEEALLRFQASRDLPKTGRLDIDSLAELHLLPVTRPARKAQTPNGAVRGVPLD